MAKLHFKHGTMGSGKSLDLIRVAYNYRERGMNIIVMKPIVDDRDGCNRCIIKSRTGAEIEGYWIYTDNDIFKKVYKYIEVINKPLHAILIDEVQFLSVEQIEQLQKVVMELHIPVICYGLKNDFKGDLFPATAKLLAVCDDIETTRTLCWCGKLAKQNARVDNGTIIKTGEVIDIGGNEKYISLCNKHFYHGQLGN